MREPERVGVGVIGLGFMGRAHIAAYEAARRAGRACELVAVCDRDPLRCAATPQAGANRGAGERGTFDPAQVVAFAEPADLLADERVRLVSVCTPTDTHVEIASAALRARKHVLVEKPVALASADVRRLLEVARGAATRCMPAFCMRFWPGWDWLKRQVESEAFGRPRSARFERLGSLPVWSREFYLDTARSGDALIDLHIHDADFARWCFGDPVAVESTGSTQHVTSRYRYADGRETVAEGGWTAQTPFRMCYRVEFEQAVAEYDSRRDPPLVLRRGAKQEAVPLGAGDGYDGEVRAMLDAIADPSLPLRATLEDALSVARLLEAELDSLRSGAPRPVRLD